MSGLGLDSEGSTDPFGFYLDGSYRARNPLPDGRTMTLVKLKGEVELSPGKKIILKANYDFDPVEPRSSMGTTTDEQYRRFIRNAFTAIQYQQTMPVGERTSNCLTLGGGVASRNRFDQGLFQVSGRKAINIGLFGLADDVSILLFRNDGISLSGNVGMSGMGQIADTDYLDYGMKSYNWDNYDIDGGLSIGIRPFNLFDLQQGAVCCHEKYNPGLYFFQDSGNGFKSPTIATFRIAPNSSFSLSHSLEGYQDQREGKLASKVISVLSVHGLELSAEADHNYYESRVDRYGAGIRFNSDKRVIINAGWEAGVFAGKIVNNEFSVGLALAFGGYMERPPKKTREDKREFDFPVNDNFTLRDAAAGLDTIKRVANFFYRSVHYPDDTAVYYPDGSLKWRYRSPRDLLEGRKGICADQSLAQAVLLVEGGYPAYQLDSHSPSGPGGHSTVMVFDPNSNRWLNLEYGSYYRLSIKRNLATPEKIAESILIARGDPHDSFFLYNPPKGFLYREDASHMSQFLINDDHSLSYVNIQDESGIKLVPEMGVKMFIGERFWE